jgi:hypothetical protein
LKWNKFNFRNEHKYILSSIFIWTDALYGSEIWTLGKNEERVINAFETWCWRRMLKIKWTDRITNNDVFQSPPEGSPNLT